jgi:hypothetical protein
MSSEKADSQESLPACESVAKVEAAPGAAATQRARNAAPPLPQQSNAGVEVQCLDPYLKHHNANEQDIGRIARFSLFFYP